jgi:hypothetical protein
MCKRSETADYLLPTLFDNRSTSYNSRPKGSQLLAFQPQLTQLFTSLIRVAWRYRKREVVTLYTFLSVPLLGGKYASDP